MSATGLPLQRKFGISLHRFKADNAEPETPHWQTQPLQKRPCADTSDCFFERGKTDIAIASTRAIDFIPDEAQCEVLHTTSLVIFVHGGGHRTHSTGRSYAKTQY